MTPMQMYWLTRLDSFSICLTTMLVISLVTSVCLFFRCIGFPSDEPGWYKDKVPLFFKSIVVTFMIMMFAILIPDTKEMAAILIVPKIVNNQKVQAMPDKLLDLANQWIAHLTPN